MTIKDARFTPFLVSSGKAHDIPSAFETFAPGPARPALPTDVAHAVRWVGPWAQHYDGTAIITRRYARALDARGVPVFLPATGGYLLEDLHEEVRHEVEALYSRAAASLRASILHVVPNVQTLRTALYPGASFEFAQDLANRVLAMTALLTVWEQLPPSDWKRDPMAVLLRKPARHIVPCEMNALVLERAGVSRDKIAVIHHPFDPKEAMALGAPRPAPFAWRAGDVPRFYTIGKWEPRKNQMAVLRAFLRACSRSRRGAEARLVVVSADWWQQGSGYPSLKDGLAEALRETDVDPAFGRNISFQTKPQPSLVPVHRAADVFVTASHGEAWGMPAFDAVLAGNRVLAPRWGGFAAYLPPEDEVPSLPYTLRPASGLYAQRLGGAASEWAEVDEGALTERLRGLIDGDEPGTGVPYSEENFERQNPTTVGKQLEAVVGELTGGPVAWR